MTRYTSSSMQLSGKIVRRLREERDLSMKSAADKANISRTYLWQIETTDHVPSIEIAKNIAEVLGTTPGNIWPSYAEADLQRTQSINDKEGTDMSDHESILEVFLEARASVNQRGSQYAETSSPLVNYYVANQYIDRFAELLQSENNEIAECLLTAGICERQNNYTGAIEAYKEAKHYVSDL
ncbi:MAG: helix-turn-helix transcriptional regulator, partial [Anaerolineales bacterium]|nr:helix-turn-helix transcriptional regulator [Anaerolineales bacterium]